MLRRMTLHTLKSLVLAVLATAALVLVAQLCGPPAEAGPAGQSSLTRALDYAYWTNYHSSSGRVQRQRADRSGPVTAVASGSTDTYNPQDLVIDGDYAYWTNYHSSVGKVQRRRADGTGSITTIASGSTDAYNPQDLVIDGDYVYWTNYHTSATYSKIQRKRKDGSGSVQTIASGATNVYNARDLVISGDYVYWTNYHTGANGKVQRKQKDGSGSITTIASGTTDVYNARDLVISGDYAYWTNYHSSVGKVQRGRANGSGSITTIAAGSTDAYQPRDLVIDGDYIYWTNYTTGANAKVQRRRADGTGSITTIASGSTDAYQPRDLVIDGDYAYWTTYHTGANGKVQRARKDGSGSVQTIASGSTDAYNPRDLVIHGSFAHWTNYHSSSGKVQRARVDGTGSVETIASGSTDAYNPRDLVIRNETESVAGDCITDAGTLAADYAAHPWNAEIDGSCPNVFHTFRLDGDADLRLSAIATDVDPVPVLRRGGIGGEVVALTTAGNGVALSYIHRAAAGEYAIEMALGPESAQSSGSFSATLETQPALDGCEVSLGTLSSERLQVYGKYDPSCGDTRKYYVYLEYQATVSISARAVGFTPRIEVRPGSASDSSTASATKSGNPADIFQSLASGAYRVNVESIAADGTYNVTFQAHGLPPPTRTPVPTPTPRFQPNQDVRLEPDPRGVRYEAGEVYRFRVEGGPGSFPALARTSSSAFRLTGGNAPNHDCNAGTELAGVGALQVVHLHVCAAAAGAAIEVVRESDYAILATYNVRSAGGETPTPDAVEAPDGYVAPPNDRIKLGVLIAAVCDGANVECNVPWVRNGVGIGGPLFLFVVPTRVARGRASGFSVGIGVAAFIIGLLLANALAGLPLEWAGMALISVFALFGLGVMLKFRRVG